MSFNKETGMYEGYIYLITNKINGKQYVGQTIQTIRKRWNGHVAKADHRPMVDRAIDKYGTDNFTIKEVEKISSNSKKKLKEKLNELEQFYIKKYDTLVSSNHGYNITYGGNTPSTYDEKPVIQYNMYGEILNTYKSLTEASEKTGVAIGDISHCCIKDNISAKGYMWSFVGDTYNQGKNGINKPVKKYDIYGNHICTYDNVCSMTDDKKLRNKICNCCTGSIRNIDGYVYRYWNDDFDKFLPICKHETLDHYKQIEQYSISGELLNTYKNCKYIKELGVIRTASLLDACRGKAKTYKGFVWKFKENE